MEADTTARLRSLLVTRRDDLVKQWVATVAASLRGRQSEAELTRQTEDLYGGLLAATDGGHLELSSSEASELRAVLGELSRNRARQGFSTTETAISVFALKDVLLAVHDTSQA